MAGRGGTGRDLEETGAITAEFAIVLTGLMVVLGAVAGLLQSAVVRIQVSDAASAAARAAARGESGERVDAVCRQLAGPQASVEVATGPDLTTVTVSRVVALPLPGTPSVTITAQSSALTEPP